MSPQYLLWLLPLVALVVGRRPAKLAVPGVLVAALGLTQAVYPGRYDELVGLASFPIWLLVARNVLLVVLTVALVEMLHPDEVPAEVPIPAEGAIEEAIESAKTFCGADAPGFVNGILAAILRDVRENAHTR